MMTEEDLTPLLIAYGLHPDNMNPVARPRLSKALRAQLAKVKEAHREELLNAKEMRIYVLNLTRGVARPHIISELVKEGNTEAAYLLIFNDEQLALLMAWRSARTVGRGSSSHVKAKAKRGKA